MILPLQVDNLELFSQIANGDMQAYAQFFAIYKNKVYTQMYLLTRSREQAEELTQDFFIRIWDKRAILEKVDKPTAYIYVLIINMARAQRRRRKKETEVLRKYLANPTSGLRNSDELLESKNLQLLIQAAVEAMPQAQRTVYKLRREQDLSYEMIGKLMKIKTNTAKLYFHRATEFIKEFLTRQYLPLISGTMAFLLLKEIA